MVSFSHFCNDYVDFCIYFVLLGAMFLVGWVLDRVMRVVDEFIIRLPYRIALWNGGHVLPTATKKSLKRQLSIAISEYRDEDLTLLTLYCIRALDKLSVAIYSCLWRH